MKEIINKDMEFNLEEFLKKYNLKECNLKELEQLAFLLRKEIINVVEKNGGHLGSNLGIIEITISLISLLNLDCEDLLLFDTGHNSYAYKILTDRFNKFPSIRQFNGISGFQDIFESKFDKISNGHAGTALSTAIGYSLTNKYRYIVVVVGDAAFLNGLNLEALNHLGTISQKIIIVLNDNGMSISKNISILQKISSHIRAHFMVQWFDKKVKRLKYIPILQGLYWLYSLWLKLFRNLEVPGLFTGFNLDYIGPINGHNIKKIRKAIKQSFKKSKSTVIHTLTNKGFGYVPAIEDKLNLHSFSNHNPNDDLNITWSKYVAECIDRNFSKYHYYLISAAMQSATYLDNFFSKHPNFSIDVGISEEHALTLAAGLLMSDQKVIINLYSTFFQRCYDQITHDIVRNKLTPIFLIDRAGLAANDGISHHGIYDVGMCKSISSHIIISQPCNQEDFEDLFKLALKNLEYPFIIRYGKAIAYKLNQDKTNDTQGINKIKSVGQWYYYYCPLDARFCLITYGDNINLAYKIIKKYNLPITLVNACFIQPYDYNILMQIFNSSYEKVITYEHLCGNVGVSQAVEHFISKFISTNNDNISFQAYYFKDGNIPHGDLDNLLKITGMDLESILYDLLDNSN